MQGNYGSIPGLQPYRRTREGSPWSGPGLTLLALWLCGFACTTADGGAVELSWKLRPASSSSPDKFVDCDSGKDGTGPVTGIRLEWRAGEVADFDEWRCADNHGVTGFALPPGPALFSVVPLCEFGPATAGTYIAPSVEQRTMIAGNTVSLGAIELVVYVTYCGTPPASQPCICNPLRP